MKSWTAIDAAAIRRYEQLDRLIANGAADPDERAEYHRLAESIDRKRYRILDQIEDARRSVQQHEATARMLGLDPSSRSGVAHRAAAADDGIPPSTPSSAPLHLHGAQL